MHILDLFPWTRPHGTHHYPKSAKSKLCFATRDSTEYNTSAGCFATATTLPAYSPKMKVPRTEVLMEEAIATSRFLRFWPGLVDRICSFGFCVGSRGACVKSNRTQIRKDLQVIKGCRKWIQGFKFEGFPKKLLWPFCIQSYSPSTTPAASIAGCSVPLLVLLRLPNELELGCKCGAVKKTPGFGITPQSLQKLELPKKKKNPTSRFNI